MATTSADTAAASRAGTRDSRKRETRRRLVFSAQDLFLAKGFESTTLEEIAAGAGVHVQTLYRHFPTKVDLAYAGMRVYFARFERAIEAGDRSGDTFSFWRRWQTDTITYLRQEYGDSRYRKILDFEGDAPGGTDVGARLSADYRRLLAKHLARDLGEDPSEIGKAPLIAGMLIDGYAAALRKYLAGDTDDLLAAVLRYIDEAEEMARPYLRPTS